MPHLIIESQENIESEIIESLHLEVGAQETVNIESLKTRFIVCKTAFEGKLAESKSNHIAITLKLLAGRSELLKEKMAGNVLAKAKELLEGRLISVEVIELGVYVK
tara:strand:+ start:377 stop:694 length:318 start_codon:yes stop_codon:yes gene_type:complete